jgi:hypothetical protein
MPPDNTNAAQRISNDILSSDYGILAISVMDTEGNIVAAKSKQSFKDTFGVNIDCENMVVFYRIQPLVWLMR